MAEPGWVTHAVWWQIYPLGFVGAPTTAGDGDGDSGSGEPGAGWPLEHRLERIVAWLDYAVELGASGIALGPVFVSESHGYDTVDYFAIDARLGDEADFDHLIAEAHRRGLRVLLDGVFNHVGRGFERFRLAAEGDAESVAWFVPLGGAAVDGAAGEGAVSEGAAVGSDDRGAGAAGHPLFEVFEGHDSLVKLNHDEPAVADFVVSVMNHWLERGADGWRLDAAYAVDPAFWARVLPRVRAEHPQVYVVGEVLHGDYSAIARAATLDSVTQYEVWKAIWSSLHDRNFFELAYALGRHNGFLSAFVPLTFVGNHDVTRLATAVDDRRHLAHALVVLLTIGGTPSIYYGDEQGFTGLKEQRAGGDDAIRPEFPAAGPSALAADDGWALYHLHQHLIGLRRRHPWLHAARTQQLELTNDFFAYEVVGTDSQERLVVLLNVGDQPYALEVARASTLLAGECTVTPTPTGATISTPPHGWAVLGA
ncbi:alpha-amylase family protein [Subtercola endophyticus]|uniref:alpha-amylase family protein n=1 Tax=Subtercola endophyticus TaxID=2895559 RepID=UPI001E574DED|nr:alpha-amylase family protein [Subtercola endophyticus]UFS59275.1 alpha-amylase family protein [Subtercola endophyticus]